MKLWTVKENFEFVRHELCVRKCAVKISPFDCIYCPLIEIQRHSKWVGTFSLRSSVFKIQGTGQKEEKTSLYHFMGTLVYKSFYQSRSSPFLFFFYLKFRFIKKLVFAQKTAQCKWRYQERNTFSV